MIAFLADTFQRLGGSFSDHQLVSPGTDEADVRRALKCCIFNNLQAHIREQAANAKMNTLEIQSRLRILHGQLRRADQSHASDAEDHRLELQQKIERLETRFADQGLQQLSLQDQLGLVAKVLKNPENHLRANTCRMRLNRMGVKLENDADDSGYELNLSEIHIAFQAPRVAALVRFPREELLPRQDFLKQANLFLAL